jgi:hypothetical protein
MWAQPFFYFPFQMFVLVMKFYNTQPVTAAGDLNVRLRAHHIYILFCVTK